MTDASQRHRRAKRSKPWWPKPTPAAASRPASRKALIFAIALAWALFQLWYASPLPYMFNFGVFNDGQARVIHLSFAFLLAFTTFPAFEILAAQIDPALRLDSGCARRDRGDATCSSSTREIALRPGLPTLPDVVVSVIGVVLLVEAARRAVGPALAAIASIMLAYIFVGPWLPGMLGHKGASLSRAASQMWLTSEGIFGVALGVSTSVVFLFVLFGSLLEKAGAGNYFIQLAFAHARHLSRRPGQGRRRRLRHDRHDLRLLDRQYRDDRHLHHPADEARRLFGGEGRRHRMRRRRQRPADAAGDGRRRLPDRRICRHHLRRGRQARLPAGVPDLRRAVLHRRHRGGEGWACAACRARRTAPIHACGAARADDDLRHHHPERRRLLRHRLDQDGVRRGGELGARRRRCSPSISR